ncbi:MAG: serine hydrolase [Oscillospiraceae bacterium]|nr:serine hydrolase [Oscillospiraceae bacterium]
MIKRLSSLLLALILSLSLFAPAEAAEDGVYAVAFSQAGLRLGMVRAMDGSYPGNIYLSLTDLAAALSGTAKQFRFERVVSSSDGEYFNVFLQQSAAMASGAEGSPAAAAAVTLSPYRNRLFVDGQERRYYTHNPKNGDLYMSVTDVQLMLDITLTSTADGFEVSDTPFAPDPVALEQSGYFEMMNGVLLADAESGQTLYYYNSGETLPVASLSKLLSYLVLREAMDSGEISMQDTVTISAAAEAVSRSGDGFVPLKEGDRVPLAELLQAMLIASSNECALALAEHLCGSEEAFVQRMKSRAAELGLNSVEIFNCSGLPVYSSGPIPVKLQNRMSAVDLYRLCCLLLKQYPDITGITSVRLAHFPNMSDYRTANSNPLIYNMSGVTGLKTGSTNRAGYCLVATMPLEAQGTRHEIILVLLGAENADVRGQAAEILLRFARNFYSG